MTSENLRTQILTEYEHGLITEKELSSLLMQFAMQYHIEQTKSQRYKPDKKYK